MAWIGKEVIEAGYPLENWVPIPPDVRDGSLYKVEYAQQVYHLTRLGATDHDLAETWKVGTQTVKRWLATYRDFAENYAKGSAEALEAQTLRVKRALYHRAVGYSFEATKFFSYEGEILSQDYIEHIPPDVNAAKFWLTNREPDNWKQENKTVVSGDPNNPIRTENKNLNINADLKDLSKEQLRAMAEERGLPSVIFDR